MNECTPSQRGPDQDRQGNGRYRQHPLRAAAGVPLTTRRILMRHAAEGVTDGQYTDATLIDLRAALDRLPMLPLNGGEPDRERPLATGTDGPPLSSVCSPVCSTQDKPSPLRSAPDNTSGKRLESGRAASGGMDEHRIGLATRVSKRANGFEPSTFSLEG